MTGDTTRLDRTTIVLHWHVAAGLLLMIGFGTYLEATPSSPDKTALIQLHKSFGVIVLALALVRLLWRLRLGFPPPAGYARPWELRLARSVQAALLVLSILIPLAGIATSIAYARPVRLFGLPFIPQILEQKNETLNELLSAAHAAMAWLLVTLLILHVAGALRHHLVRKDRTLLRIIGR